MKISDSNTKLRIITATVMVAIALIAATLEGFGIPFLHIAPFHAVRWLGIIIVAGMIIETIKCYSETSRETFQNNATLFICFLGWLLMMIGAAYVVGARPWIILWLFLIIAGADTGAWLFGKIFGGDKMWERLSQNKTWAGQIGGIICGTFMSILYGLLGTDVFRPELLWIGIGVSLLSQYGDLTASYIKRKLGIKDFGNLLPGHGGLIDRFDGWIYVLPLIWFIIS